MTTTSKVKIIYICLIIIFIFGLSNFPTKAYAENSNVESIIGDIDANVIFMCAVVVHGFNLVGDCLVFYHSDNHRKPFHSHSALDC